MVREIEAAFLDGDSEIGFSRRVPLSSVNSLVMSGPARLYLLSANFGKIRPSTGVAYSLD